MSVWLKHLSETSFTLDIGGEGRHADAWNLNPQPLKTLGQHKGTPIPNWIAGRADQIPLPDQSVSRIIMERTPLRRTAILEILRVITPGGEVTLRHALCNDGQTHNLAHKLMFRCVSTNVVQIGRQSLFESHFRIG